MCRELVYPIGRNRGESVAHVKDVISKGGKLLKKGSLAVFDNYVKFFYTKTKFKFPKKRLALLFTPRPVTRFAMHRKNPAIYQ